MYDYWSDDQRANKWVLILKNKNKQIAKKPVICCNKNKLKKKHPMKIPIQSYDL